jgi:hypothetical protein
MGNVVSTQSQVLFGAGCLGGFAAAHQLSGALLRRLLPKTYGDGGALEQHQWQNFTVAGVYTSLVAFLGWRETYGSAAGPVFPPPPSTVAGVSAVCRWLTLSMGAYLVYDFCGILRALRLTREAKEAKEAKGAKGAKEASSDASARSAAAGKFFHHALGFFGVLSCLFTDMGGKVNMW